MMTTEELLSIAEKLTALASLETRTREAKAELEATLTATTAAQAMLAGVQQEITTARATLADIQGPQMAETQARLKRVTRDLGDLEERYSATASRLKETLLTTWREVREAQTAALA